MTYYTCPGCGRLVYPELHTDQELLEMPGYSQWWHDTCLHYEYEKSVKLRRHRHDNNSCQSRA